MSDDAPKPSGLGQATVRGARWTYLSMAFNGLLQVIVFAILARLLPPPELRGELPGGAPPPVPAARRMCGEQRGDPDTGRSGARGKWGG